MIITKIVSAFADYYNHRKSQLIKKLNKFSENREIDISDTDSDFTYLEYINAHLHTHYWFYDSHRTRIHLPIGLIKLPQFVERNTGWIFPFIWIILKSVGAK